MLSRGLVLESLFSIFISDLHTLLRVNDQLFSGWISKIYDKKDVTDAYVEVFLGNARLIHTQVIDNDLNPKWLEEHRYKDLFARGPFFFFTF